MHSRIDPIKQAEGCLLVAAAGDSMGAYVEFWKKDHIISQFGEAGIREPLGFQDHGFGSITDDTQQALAVMRGLLHGKRCGGTKKTYLHDVWLALKYWRELQEKPFFNRAPGLTNLCALEQDTPGTMDEPLNTSKGCGAVMRAHPIGLFFHANPLVAFHMGLHIGALTHGDPDGYGPSGFLAWLIATLMQSSCQNLQVFDEFVSQGLSLLHHHLQSAAGTQTWIKHVLEQPPSSLQADLKKNALGWTGDEALAIAIAAIRKHFGPSETIDLLSFASTHDGDSDSTASIAGAIHGTIHGPAGLPSNWIRRLEDNKEILFRAKEMLDEQPLPTL